MATLKTGWIKKLINGTLTRVFAISHAKCCYYNYTNNKTVYDELGNKVNTSNPTSTGAFSHNRKSNSTVGENSSTLGYNNIASGKGSHAEGGYVYYGDCLPFTTTASGDSSHAEGGGTIASGFGSHAEGNSTTASGQFSHAEGFYTTASGQFSHAEGYQTTASGDSSHAEGYQTTALNYQHVIGHHNNTTNATNSTNAGTGTGSSFVVGNGISGSNSNAFRVNDSGAPYSKSGLVTTGCDYAEYFEWLDENTDSEDRRGYFVTLDGKHIKIAEPDDWILGIVSGFPSIIGNGDEDWLGRYIFDEFGTPIIEEFEYEIEDSDGKVIKETGTKWKENPDYDPTIPYIERKDRKEWAAVGMLGVLSVRDDGTCKVNGFCKVADGGIATASDNGYRVVKRVTDNIVEVIFK